jgi:regulator of sirC expression with transglutaminase-like and TPR domain
LAPPFFLPKRAILSSVLRDSVVKAFAHAANSPDPDLAVAALMIARVEYPRLDAGPYLDQLDALGREALRRVSEASLSRRDAPAGVDPLVYARVMALNDYLFGELRFTGNDLHFEDPRNSFLNEVIDRRTGIPITLALLYIEVARRAGIRVEGINFPEHFLVRCPTPRGRPYTEDLIIDAHHGGALLSEAACRRMLRRRSRGDGPDDLEEGQEAEERDRALESRVFAHATKPQMMSRMLLNLKNIYVRMHSFPQARDVTELMLAVDPAATSELRDRGLLAYHLNDFHAALRDLQAYLRLSAGTDLDADAREEHEQIWEHIKTLRRRVASLN